MLKYVSVSVLVACFLASGLSGQNILFGDLAVGTPYSFDFGEGFSEIPTSGSVDGISYSVTFSYNFTVSSGSLPPGLTLSPSGLLSGTPTEGGTYTFTLTLAYSLTETIDGMSFNYDGTFPYPALTLDVTGSSGPAVAVNPSGLTFSLTQGSTTPSTQSIVIGNTGSSAESFSASATTTSGGSWLSVSSGSGTVAPFSNGSVSVNVNPSGLSAGTYLGTVSISVSPLNQQFDVAVIATVSGGQAQLQISQSGLFYETVAGGGQPSAQSVTLLNGGSGSLNFSVSASTTSGGSQWLSVSPSSGTVTPATSAAAVVTINAAGLAAGDYYGQVQFSASGAANSPQTVSVVLHIASATTDLGASVNPTGLVFIGQAASATPPASQTISVTNPSSSALTFAAATFFDQGNAWFTVQPGGGMVSATNPAQLTVQPVLTGLAPGVYAGEIVLQFIEDQTSRHIAVLLVVTPASPAGKTAHAVSQTSSACTPTKLYPVFTQLGANFSTVAAWPTPIAVIIVDDCGNFMTSGSVTASFSDGDPSLPLTSLDNGNWSATWQPRSSSSQVVITVDALEAAPPLAGTQSIGGSLQANPSTPSVNAVVSAATYAQNQPLAPGAFASIYGVHLSGGPNAALALPLATQLGGTQVVLGGRPLPLQYAGNGQVNAIIPYDIPPNSTQQLIVTNGPALSVPLPVVVAPAQPAVFAQADGTGVVFDVKPGATAQVPVDAQHPISAGDAIVIYCAGLGPVNPPVAAGAAAPSSPPAKTTNTVTVSIGGKSAQVFFSGLVGGLAGEYQVNAYVPKGIAPGNAVPLVITVAGFESAPVNVAVK